ncbi:MAG: hypothetical protein IJB74_09490 [Clostridia bacterium]|nr:hypothetical protein [Clostridia bacterium]
MLKLMHYDLQSIILKIQSVLLSAVLFVIGIIYSDTPTKINCTVYINGTEISSGYTAKISLNEDIAVHCACKNIGKPFEGKDIYNAGVSVYRYINGEKIYINLWSISVDAEPRPILIKSDEKFDVYTNLFFDPDNKPEPGIYSMNVTVYGNTQIYENVLMITE